MTNHIYINYSDNFFKEFINYQKCQTNYKISLIKWMKLPNVDFIYQNMIIISNENIKKMNKYTSYFSRYYLTNKI